MSAIIPPLPKVDLAKAAAYLAAHAQLTSTGYCARAVRLALEAGGMNTDGHPASAKEYGPFLEAHGFVPVQGYDVDRPELGDIAVLPALPGYSYGHICMFDGAHWLSDFKQRDMWAGPVWREARVFTAYRQS